jgi:hypothetical protein
MSERKIYARSTVLDEVTDAWVEQLITSGGNFSAWVREQIRLQIAKEGDEKE